MQTIHFLVKALVIMQGFIFFIIKGNREIHDQLK